jgi:hypothetical protein
VPLSTRRTRIRSPGRWNANGNRRAWLRPCMKIFAMQVSASGNVLVPYHRRSGPIWHQTQPGLVPQIGPWRDYQA